MRIPTLLLVLALVGCAATKLPAPAPDAERETIRLGARTCRGGRCIQRTSLADRPLRVVSRTRTLQRHQLPGRAAEKSGAGGRALGFLFREAGGTLWYDRISTTTRTLEDPADGGWQVTCQSVVVWEESRSKDSNSIDDEDEPESFTRGTGSECAIRRGTDSTAAWRYRAGLDPSLDSVSAVLDNLPSVMDVDGRPRLDTLETLEHASGTRYDIVSRASGLGTTRVTHVARDTVLVLTVRRNLMPEIALDFSPYATDEERHVLRRLMAALLTVD